jgi:hypothetical protein
MRAARVDDEVSRMISTDSVYEACYELFANYPLAVSALDASSETCSMVLLLLDGSDARFFVLVHDRGVRSPSFSVFPWHAAGGAKIEPHGVVSDGTSLDDVVDVVTCGIPIPADGSVFGWTVGEAVTALVAVRARYTPASLVPGWAAMPLVGVPEAQWPPFVAERFFGHWFWEYYRTGRVICLDELIAQTDDTVFWVDTKASLGVDCCVVARDINSAEKRTLQRGCYVYYDVLHAGKPVPSLAALLASTAKTDLAPRFRSSRHCMD